MSVLNRKWWRVVTGREGGGISNGTTSTAFAATRCLRKLDDERNSLRREKLSLVAELPVLEITEPVRDLVEVYIARFVMPRDPVGDALHLALASYYNCDILLTWNCKHLANEDKIDHILRVNTLLNVRNPRIITPLELLGGPEMYE